MVGPEVPEKIQKIRDIRLGRAKIAAREESSDDEDFAGPSLDDFKDNENIDEELAAKERFKGAKIAQLRKDSGIAANSNDSKHDSWMSMKPDWAENTDSKKNAVPLQSVTVESVERSQKPSLMEQHQASRKRQGLDEKAKVTYDTNESLNAEVRREVFRKASSLNDRFTKGS